MIKRTLCKRKLIENGNISDSNYVFFSHLCISMCLHCIYCMLSLLYIVKIINAMEVF